MNQIINHKGKHYLKTEIGYREVLATTDISLKLPQIPQQFIEQYIAEYNKGNVISEVELEYEEYLDQSMSEHGCYRQILKTTSNNEVIIKSIEQKLYTKDEIITLMKLALARGECGNLSFEEMTEPKKFG